MINSSPGYFNESSKGKNHSHHNMSLVRRNENASHFILVVDVLGGIGVPL